MLETAQRIDRLAVACFFPWLADEPIGAFRRAHHPTAHMIGPHMTLVFPAPASIGWGVFEAHVRGVVSRTSPFAIRLKGLGKTWDHWMYLEVAEGRDQVIALNDVLYTGILSPFARTDPPYVPHVGLGYFGQEAEAHEFLVLRPRAFDASRFDRALREAQALNLDYAGPVEGVQVLGLDDELTHVTDLVEIPLG